MVYPRDRKWAKTRTPRYGRKDCPGGRGETLSVDLITFSDFVVHQHRITSSRNHIIIVVECDQYATQVFGIRVSLYDRNEFARFLLHYVRIGLLGSLHAWRII